MLTELYSGDYSVQERRKRYTLAMCWMEGGAERAVSLAEELLQDVTDDACLWAAYLANKLALNNEEIPVVAEIEAFLARDLSRSVKLSAISKVIGQKVNPAISSLTIYTLLWIYRSGKPDADALNAYHSLLESLLSSGQMSFARDFVEFMNQEGGFDEGTSRFSQLVDVLEDSYEKPIYSLSAMMLQWSCRFDPSDELFSASHYSSLMPYTLAAWSKLHDSGANLDYQHLPLDERKELLDSFMRDANYYRGIPSEVDLSKVLTQFFQEDIDWRLAQGYPVGSGVDPDDEVENVEDDEAMTLPDFDDEDYMSFVDYVVDHYEQIFPDSPPEQRIFVPLFLLPVYADGSRISDVKATLVADSDQSLFAYMRDMMMVAEDLWKLQSMHDEVDKALSLIEVYDFASDVCRREFAYQSIELMLSTMHFEKKTIQKLMKESRREKR